MTLAVEAARAADLDAVMRLLNEARAWHRALGVDAWREFDRSRIAADIEAHRVFLASGQAGVCGTITLFESDTLVWGADDAQALYVHKLAVRRDVAGQGIGAAILRWAQDEARSRGRRCLRLDTWDGNRRMRQYYERQGFRHVRDQFFPADSPLPADYRGTHKSLYQLDV